MKNKQSPTELRIAEAIQKEIGPRGGSHIERDVEDNPDFVFSVDGRIICADASGIPSDRILRYHHRRFGGSEKPPLRGKEIVYAFEPHMWLKEVIQAKQKKLKRYLSNSSAVEAWLIVHCHEQHTDIVSASIDNITVLRASASAERHGFTKILFWDSEIGLIDIWNPGDPKRKVQFDLSKGYPVRGFRIWTTAFTTTAEGAPPEDIDLGKIEFDKIYPPPLDPEFRKHPPRKVFKSMGMAVEIGDTWAKHRVIIGKSD